MDGGDIGPGQMPDLVDDIIAELAGLKKQVGDLNRLLERARGPGLIEDYLDLPWDPPLTDDEREKVFDIFNRKGRDIILRAIRIVGVEATQSTQFFQFNNLGSDAGSHNSIPLVAEKDLILRVYLDSNLTRGRISGTVRYAGKTIAPINGPLSPRRSTSIRRDNLNHTLNFRIPLADCRGSRTFLIQAHDLDTPGMFGKSGTYRLEVDFLEVPRVRVYGVMIDFTGNSLNLPGPNGLRLVDTFARCLPMFPFPGVDYGKCDRIAFNGSLMVRKGWDDLLLLISKMRSESTEKGVYVGLLAPNTAGQVGTSTRGIGNTGVMVAAQDDTRAFGHEFGHALGLDHASACGEGDTIDAKFPTYGSYMQGSIGEVGLNTSRMVAFDPRNSWDFMTYCDNPDVLFPPASWVSPYHYLKMMQASRRTGGMTSAFREKMDLRPHVVISLRIERDGSVELLPSYRVLKPLRERDERERTNVVLDLFNRQGELIDSHRCHVFNPYQDRDGAYLDFQEVIPWPEDIARVVVIREGQELATYDAGGELGEIRVSLDRREREHQGDLIRVRWEGLESAGEVHYSLRYSHDGGQTWMAVATDLTEPHFVLDLDTQPGGERCLFEVIAASGLAFASAHSEPFEVRRKPRQAVIAEPRDGARYLRGEPVTFAGGGHSPDYGTSAPDETSWSSSIDGYLGSGQYFTREDLSPGKHRITVSVRDGQGGEAAASVYVEVGEQIYAPCDPPVD